MRTANPRPFPENGRRHRQADPGEREARADLPLCARRRSEGCGMRNRVQRTGSLSRAVAHWVPAREGALHTD